jgi:hypothetical protein
MTTSMLPLCSERMKHLTALKEGVSDQGKGWSSGKDLKIYHNPALCVYQMMEPMGMGEMVRQNLAIPLN